jgi:hypothetical protein
MVMWHTLGSWSGKGNTQTESFPSEGGLRIDWETKHEAAPGAGVFKLTVNSAISGRVIRDVVDQHGVGRGTASVTDDPRQYYAVVESSNLDWKFTISEGVGGTVQPKP